MMLVELPMAINFRDPNPMVKMVPAIELRNPLHELGSFFC